MSKFYIMDSNKIHLLNSVEAQKIAAGEVVDRPAALVREFIDNAIDSGASEIDVLIEDGGLKSIALSDNGCGISSDDLSLACLKHATSKITCIDDLKQLSTLGFRGEALSAAAAVSHLEIISSTDGITASRLTCRPGEDSFRIQKGARTQGTSIKSFYLFDTIPARKMFLKNSSTEAIYCKKIFTEKSLAYPNISFRFFEDGKLKLSFTAVKSLKKRFCDAVLKCGDEQLLYEIRGLGSNFSISIVIGGPNLPQKNRRFQYIYVNGRRINDFSLQQAIEYGTSGWFPNGTHPLGAVFIQIDSAYADFNVHPAKIEVRFADPSAIHHVISLTLRNFVKEYETNAAAAFKKEMHNVPIQNSPMEAQHADKRQSRQPSFYDLDELAANYDIATFPPKIASASDMKVRYTNNKDAGNEMELAAKNATYKDSENELKYVGRVFDLFIIIEKENRLFLLDQHAAHERILYEHLLAKPIIKQDLLVPITFTTESTSEDAFLTEKSAELKKLGLIVNKEGGKWCITAVPALWRLSDTQTVTEILALNKSGEDFTKRWIETIACHAAIKDGDYIDKETALALAEEALNLPVLRCPHGRPFVTEIKKDDLLKAVKRL